MRWIVAFAIGISVITSNFEEYFDDVIDVTGKDNEDATYLSIEHS